MTNLRDISFEMGTLHRYIQDVLVEGPSIWSLTDRLCHGILQMGYIGPQVLCEVGGELPALGTALRSWTSQLRVGMPRILTAQT